MYRNESEYEVRKKYCPALRRNVIIKVFFGEFAREECIENPFCKELGGCKNQYLHSSDRESHSS